jgi:hypothetical protein
MTTAAVGPAALPARRRVNRLVVWALAVVVVIAAMVVWGIDVHKHAPRWAPGQALSVAEARGVLADSIAGLDTATLEATVKGDLGLQLRATVDLRSRPLAAALATQPLGQSGGTAYRMTVRGGSVYIHLHGRQWASVPIKANAKGFVPTLLSQMTGGISLRHLFRGAEKGLRTATYVGPFSDAALRVAGDEYAMTVSARSVRALLPSLLTQRSDQIRRTVPVTLYVDNHGRLLRFQTVMNKDAVTVVVTDRNPKVEVKRPRGIVTPLGRLTGGVQITAAQALAAVGAQPPA